MSPRAPSRITLETPVNYLAGVGPRRAELLKRLNIFTARDLLFHIPHRYEDASTVRPIAGLKVGDEATVIGEVISKGIIPTRKGLRVFQAIVRDESGHIEASFPGQPWLDRQIEKGDLLLLSGPVRFYHGRQLAPREFVNLGSALQDDTTDTKEGRVLSVYPATEGLSFKILRGLIEKHLDALLDLVDEYLPAKVLAEAGVPPIREALRAVHRPSSVAEAMRGRSRLAFEELFFVHLLQRRARALLAEAKDGIEFVNKKDLTTRFRGALPFTLTKAQVRVVREIVADMCSAPRMQRLLQGDVGSGKTVVAIFAALLAMENDYQVALMAPTELLAEQHARTLDTLLAPLGIVPVLVTGSRTAKERRVAATRLESGESLIAIGTHALVQEGTRFAKLGLAIIDEQHRFGVDQRRVLTERVSSVGTRPGKGEKYTQRPDVLLMSATPIPRSLALTMYGDLDVSFLDERPPGRQPITTAQRPENARARVMDFVVRQIDAGRQAYIVYPLIDESEKVALKAATKAYDELMAGALKGRRVALLHGRLASDEKDDIMRRFRDGVLDALVSTTVIEVGIDVPNATVMLIEHPERFGLSQLHQLRGRVGRGAAESYCILMGDVSPDVAERLSVFLETEDGFKIAEADLRQRGMGDLFGERQSGVPTFKVADPMRDVELSDAARAAAERVLVADPTLAKPEYRAMQVVLKRQYGRALELFSVG